jgi:hypothetical protein
MEFSFMYLSPYGILVTTGSTCRSGGVNVMVEEGTTSGVVSTTAGADDEVLHPIQNKRLNANFFMFFLPSSLISALTYGYHDIYLSLTISVG